MFVCLVAAVSLSEFHAWRRQFEIVTALALSRNLDPPLGQTVRALLNDREIDRIAFLQSVSYTHLTLPTSDLV